MWRIYRAEIAVIQWYLLWSHIIALAALLLLAGLLIPTVRGKQVELAEVFAFFLLWGMMLSHVSTMTRLGLDKRRGSRIRLHASLPVTIHEIATTKVAVLLTIWLASAMIAVLLNGFVWLAGRVSILEMSLVMCAFFLWIDGFLFIIEQIEDIWGIVKRIRQPVNIAIMVVVFGLIMAGITSFQGIVDIILAIVSIGLGTAGMFLVGMMMFLGGYALFMRRRSFLM